MMRRKSLLSLALALCLCFMMTVPALAADAADTSNFAEEEVISEFPNSEEMADLVEIAKAVEHGKETWGDGCADMDFSKLTVGKKIREYIYTDNGFEEAGVAYPIIYNDKLFLLALQNSDGGFNTAGTRIEKKISEYIDTDTNFAFVYDSTTCYLYDGTNWVKLYQYPENQERPLLNPMARIDTADIRMTTIAESIPLNLNFTEEQSDTANTEYGYSPTKAELDGIVDCLNGVVSINKIRLSDGAIDYGIGQRISAYRYKEGTFKPSVAIYPVYKNNELYTLAIGGEDDHINSFALSRELVEPIKNSVTGDKEFALVFDRQNCYLFDGETWVLLKHYMFVDTSKGILDTVNLTDTSAIEIRALSEISPLTELYMDTACHVDFVGQSTDNIC